MKFVFVRHGKPVSRKGMKKQSEKDARPLTDAGREDARRAAEFLRSEKIRPDFLVTTNKRRTMETGAIVKETLGLDCPELKVGGGFKINASRGEIVERIVDWMKKGKVSAKVLLFVGHEDQQQALVTCADDVPEIPEKNHGVVLVYVIDDRGKWTVGPHFLG